MKDISKLTVTKEYYLNCNHSCKPAVQLMELHAINPIKPDAPLSNKHEFHMKQLSDSHTSQQNATCTCHISRPIMVTLYMDC